MKSRPGTAPLWFLISFSYIILNCYVARAAADDENWDSSFGVPGANGPISRIAVVGNDVYFAGEFSSIGGINATNIARWDGASWHSLGAGLNGHVSSLFVSGNDLYVGGTFTQAGSTAATNIARWNGTNWASAAPGAVSSSALAVAGENIYIGWGAGFRPIGEFGAINIARWNGTNWSGLDGGVSVLCRGFNDYFECGSVHSLAVLDGALYAGGSFRTAGGVEVNNIAQWNGTNWSTPRAGLRTYDMGQQNGFVFALLSQGSVLFAGGQFNLAGGVYIDGVYFGGGINATNVARWDGTNWASLGSGVGRGGYVSALAIQDTSLYAGGRFASAGGLPSPSIAKWNGQDWSALGSGLTKTLPSSATGPASIQALAARGGQLFVGGIIETAGGKPSTNIALWHIPPTLSATLSADKLTLSWPTTGSNFVLESKSALGPSSWDEVPQPPAVVGDQLIVTNSILLTNQFFRLRRR